MSHFSSFAAVNCKYNNESAKGVAIGEAFTLPLENISHGHFAQGRGFYAVHACSYTTSV